MKKHTTHTRTRRPSFAAWGNPSRLDYVEKRRDRLTEIVRTIQEADQLLDGFASAKGWADFDGTTQEITSRVLKAIRELAGFAWTMV